jgi:hypothetical protein
LGLGLGDGRGVGAGAEAGAEAGVGAGAAKKNCPGTIQLRYTHLPYSVASDSKLLETSRGLGLGRERSLNEGPAASRHRRQKASAREGDKVWNVPLHRVSVEKVLKTLF